MNYCSLPIIVRQNKLWSYSCVMMSAIWWVGGLAIRVCCGAFSPKVNMTMQNNRSHFTCKSFLFSYPLPTPPPPTTHPISGSVLPQMRRLQMALVTGTRSVRKFDQKSRLPRSRSSSNDKVKYQGHIRLIEVK